MAKKWVKIVILENQMYQKVLNIQRRIKFTMKLFKNKIIINWEAEGPLLHLKYLKPIKRIITVNCLELKVHCLTWKL